MGNGGSNPPRRLSNAGMVQLGKTRILQMRNGGSNPPPGNPINPREWSNWGRLKLAKRAMKVRVLLAPYQYLDGKASRESKGPNSVSSGTCFGLLKSIR